MAKKSTVAALALGFTGLMALTGSCLRWGVGGATLNREEAIAMDQSIERAQEELTPQVMVLPGVVGIAIGECEGTPCIKILVRSKSRHLVGKIPSTYKGYKVRVDTVGEIRGPRPIP